MDETNEYEIIGLIGGLIFPICLIPQLTKTYKRKAADDLSLVWLLMTIVALILHLIYALAEELLPLYIPLTFELFEMLILVGMKRKYDAINYQNYMENFHNDTNNMNNTNSQNNDDTNDSDNSNNIDE